MCDGRQFWPGHGLAARKRGCGLLFLPALNANPLKVERMRALGAEVRLVGENFKVVIRLRKCSRGNRSTAY